MATNRAPRLHHPAVMRGQHRKPKNPEVKKTFWPFGFFNVGFWNIWSLPIIGWTFWTLAMQFMESNFRALWRFSVAPSPAPVSKKRPLRISRPDWMHASYVLERPVMIRYVCVYVGMPSAWCCRPMFPQTTWLSCFCSDTWTKAKQNNDMLQRPKALKRVF